MIAKFLKKKTQAKEDKSTKHAFTCNCILYTCICNPDISGMCIYIKKMKRK